MGGEGRWKVKTIKSPVTIAISDGKRTKVVHIHRLQHRYQPSHHNQIEIETSAQQTWNPPGVDHIYLPLLQFQQDAILHGKETPRTG